MASPDYQRKAPLSPKWNHSCAMNRNWRTLPRIESYLTIMSGRSHTWNRWLVWPPKDHTHPSTLSFVSHWELVLYNMIHFVLPLSFPSHTDLKTTIHQDQYIKSLDQLKSKHYSGQLQNGNKERSSAECGRDERVSQCYQWECREWRIVGSSSEVISFLRPQYCQKYTRESCKS
jgi:hypothetical protein